MIAALIIACWVVLTSAAVSPAEPAVETLIVDTRVPVLVAGNWVIMSRDEHRRYLARRDTDGSTASSSTTTTKTASSASDDDGTVEVTTTISLGASTTTSTASATTTTAVSSPLPSPFDQAMGSNFTSDDKTSCPNFISTLLADSTFKSCYAFSMLVQGSTSFFQAERSLVSMTRVLDATCAVNSTACVEYMDQQAKKLTSSSNCGPSYEQGVSVVFQMYAGLRAYQPLYSAACLKAEDTSQAYCFASAVINSSAVSDVYLYYLPLNISYPSTSKPTCNSCTQRAMTFFQAATSDRTRFISETYAAAAAVVNDNCGAGFVNATLPSATVLSGAPSIHQPTTPLLIFTLLIMALSHWVL